MDPLAVALRTGRRPRRFKLPVSYFTYQVLDVDSRSQLLLTEVGRPHGVAFHGAYERGLNDYGGMRRRATMTIVDRRTEPAVTPDGREMQLPASWTWTVQREDKRIVPIALHCVASDDWTYGLGAGYVGSFEYAGAYHTRTIEGTGYVEYIDTQGRQ